MARLGPIVVMPVVVVAATVPASRIGRRVGFGVWRHRVIRRLLRLRRWRRPALEPRRFGGALLVRHDDGPVVGRRRHDDARPLLLRGVRRDDDCARVLLLLWWLMWLRWSR